MCELLGLSARNKIFMNDYFKAFFSHGIEHKNGWGLALLDSDVDIKKEPVKASDSLLLKQILADEIETSSCIAHIRKATIGDIVRENTHPFAKRDHSGRMWVLAHNGTIFDSPVLAPYQYCQSGTSDSERILLYIVDEIDKHPAVHRIQIVEDAIRNIVPGNKVNVLIHDGEYLYVHKNEADTLYAKEDKTRVILATRPLDEGIWKEVRQNTLHVYKDGELKYQGQSHSHTYVHDENRMKLLYFNYSSL